MQSQSAEQGEGALSSRVVLLTGASGGLGQEVARVAAAAGATVILCGRRVRPLEKLYDELVESGAAQPAIYPIDLEGATPADFEAMAASIDLNFGRLDGLVHAAAHFTGLMSSAQLPPDEWLKSIQVNLNAPVALSQACFPLLARSADASLVLVLDQLERVGKAHWGAYGVSKHAQSGLLSQWAAEYDNTPVRVHGLIPKPMRTRLRARAYFAEDPALVDTPVAAAKAVVELLSSAGAGWRGRLRDLNRED